MYRRQLCSNAFVIKNYRTVLSVIAYAVRIIRTSADINTLAETVEDNGGVYFVPALTGLGAPYWELRDRKSVV